MKSKLPYYTAISHFLGIGPRKLQTMIKRFGDIVSAYNAPVSDIQALLGENIGAEFESFRKGFSPDKETERILRKGIHIITREDARYPDQLSHLHSQPICLYMKGEIEKYDLSNLHALSIVGSRKTTSYGRSMARMFGKELAEAGWTVVSGMALGIDGQAHWGALDAGGRTIAILGCGVEVVYPWEHRSLYESILSHGGLVISEFPPEMQVRKGYFVTRNRLVSGISLGTVVIEGALSSGSLITARYALEQGKDVFALPGSIMSDLSKGPHSLIQQGAKLITSTQEILEEYEQVSKSRTTRVSYDLLQKEEIQIYEYLLNENATIDMLCESLSKRSYQLLPLLSSLEMKGIVKCSDQGVYEVVK